MRIARTRSCWILVAALLVQTGASASTPEPRITLAKYERQIRDAALLPKSDERSVLLRSLLEEHLLSDSRLLRLKTFSFMVSYADEIGVEEFGDILARYDALEHTNTGQGLLDRCALEHLPFSQRTVIYRDAIVNGSRDFGVESTLRRTTAIRYVVAEGMHELGPVIEENFKFLSNHEKQGLSLDFFLTLLELRRRQSDDENSTLLAVTRIQDMDPTIFRSRMDEDAAFQKAVLDTFKSACEWNPFLDGTSASCTAVRGVVDQQRAYFLSERATRKTAVPEWMNSIVKSRLSAHSPE